MTTTTGRPRLHEIGLAPGKQARLHRIVHEHGLRNGTALFLPYDQGLEHGPRDFAVNPDASDPGYVLRLAVEGGFNGIVLQVGLVQKFAWEFAGEVPLVLKLNGRTDVPPADAPVSPLQASVEDAVRLGADAVGYTLYVGTAATEADYAQLRRVRADADRFGMPLIVWAYPRGWAVDEKGGRDSFYEVDYAARVASELGADMVKVNFPDPDKHTGVPAKYRHPMTSQEAIDRVVRSANRTMLLVSGGSRLGDEAMLTKARMSMEAGATGLIFGRNVWQREHGESLRFVEQLRAILAEYPDHHS